MILTTTAHAVILFDHASVPGAAAFLSAYRLGDKESKDFLFILRPGKLLVPRRK